MNTDPLQIQIHITERWLDPPRLYAEDEDNPTPEEIAEHEQQWKRWEAAGGYDQRYFRARLMAGNESAFKEKDSTRLKTRSIESAWFHKDDTIRRMQTYADMWKHIGASVSHCWNFLPMPQSLKDQ